MFGHRTVATRERPIAGVPTGRIDVSVVESIVETALGTAVASARRPTDMD